MRGEVRRDRCRVTQNVRGDAVANGRRIVNAARSAFAAGGLDVPMREIARDAGLAVATVYRHFPSRDDLVEAVLAEKVAQCGVDMRTDLADESAGRALRRSITRFADQFASDRGLTQALLGGHPAGARFADQRRAHSAAFERLVTRAHDDGALRPDVSVDDARVALVAVASVRPALGDRGATTRRLTHLLLAGLMNDQ